ncbi:hypothetical protein PS862_01436 [Pseudomonas fluorescens]|uniref:RHS repeat-associated core domain-containing protein n=1 Tax=Pseudomonas fluorescens TaxID=294 RepID=A0A5E7IEG5_PSEFL|nr:hypothetical protein PS862_01436 [Pseudomonas fluorescens]
MRFHSPDSWSPFGEGGLNAYMYCLGNPIRYTDKTGHMSGRALAGILDSLDDVAAIGRRTSNVSDSIPSTSRGLSRGTDNVAELPGSGRPSRPITQQAPTTRPKREPIPDYDSPERSNSPTRRAQDTADQRSREIAREKERANRRANKIARRIERHPDEYKAALRESKPNSYTGRKDAQGHRIMTTDKLAGHNDRFDLPVYRTSVDVNVKQKQVREYQ